MSRSPKETQDADTTADGSINNNNNNTRGGHWTFREGKVILIPEGESTTPPGTPPMVDCTPPPSNSSNDALARSHYMEEDARAGRAVMRDARRSSSLGATPFTLQQHPLERNRPQSIITTESSNQKTERDKRRDEYITMSQNYHGAYIRALMTATLTLPCLLAIYRKNESRSLARRAGTLVGASQHALVMGLATFILFIVLLLEKSLWMYPVLGVFHVFLITGAVCRYKGKQLKHKLFAVGKGNS
eukprot:PhM_4_TR9386/c0_g1_i2/m.11293